jgi:hypothetical protein
LSGKSRKEICLSTGIKPNTYSKALCQKRIVLPAIRERTLSISTKSSRKRLCLSGSTDYWINDKLGHPLFVIYKTLNEGKIKVVKDEIIPRLNREVASQPAENELQNNPQLHRYMLVFDREGYSVDFFEYLSEQRIAFCTYRKNVKEDWPDEEFTEYTEIDGEGEKEVLQLAERETILYGQKEKGKPKKTVTVREIRKKSPSGHQTAIITTNKRNFPFPEQVFPIQYNPNTPEKTIHFFAGIQN